MCQSKPRRLDKGQQMWELQAKVFMQIEGSIGMHHHVGGQTASATGLAAGSSCKALRTHVLAVCLGLPL